MSVDDTSKESIEAKNRERTDTAKVSKKIKIIKKIVLELSFAYSTSNNYKHN